MDKLDLMWAWIQANPIVFTAITVYVIANLMPRPHPEKMTGWKRTFWSIVDGLCVLTADKVPGNLKWLLANSPPIKAETHVADKAGEPSVDDGPSDDGPEEEEEQPLSETSEKVEK